jgi:hypothetical protein
MLAPMVKQNDTLKVELQWKGDGLSGDFDPHDPEDVPLLRFMVEKRQEETWVPVEGGDRITTLPATLTDAKQSLVVDFLLSRLTTAYQQGQFKQMAAKLAWMDLSSLFPPENPASSST